ncbi:hypothetical protein ATE84_3814 [Aquimarina sp. MAR_2010_214]|uniref:hypothetical protein n=1 Tax=Aquimarina sp. MAR_2010_214 TaxID=1250026 RepID=UPI000C705DA9|nr:hypothetical protein [Aquimarina sp. MAR_2010_214]PKV51716.1 hypothetical protein ATE84_3814 [Aquimarina sp. MAR_2010_214]
MFTIFESGNPSNSIQIPVLKKPKTRIYFIFYTSGDFEEAAKTREREINSLEEYNHVFMKEYKDLWEIAGFVAECIKKVESKKWKKTSEVCFYCHGGTDGPVGEVETSQYNLADETGQKQWDSKQMSLKGWKQINFNFDPNYSIAAFYGCKNITFAENFLDIHNVMYTAAHGGGSADSESYEEFDSSWFTFSGENIYYVSPTNINSGLAPMEIMKKGKPKWKRSINNSEIVTNIGLDEKGNIYGKGKGGALKIKKENIAYAKYSY